VPQLWINRFFIQHYVDKIMVYVLRSMSFIHQIGTEFQPFFFKLVIALQLTSKLWDFYVAFLELCLKQRRAGYIFCFCFFFISKVRANRYELYELAYAEVNECLGWLLVHQKGGDSIKIGFATHFLLYLYVGRKRDVSAFWASLYLYPWQDSFTVLLGCF